MCWWWQECCVLGEKVVQKTNTYRHAVCKDLHDTDYDRLLEACTSIWTEWSFDLAMSKPLTPSQSCMQRIRDALEGKVIARRFQDSVVVVTHLGGN